MSKTTIKEILSAPADWSGKTVALSGWVRTVRDSKTFGFLELHDGSCFKPIQVVMESGALPNFEEAVKLNVGAAVTLAGTVIATPGAQQAAEVKALSLAVVGPSAPDYPLQKKRHTMEYTRTIAHLRPRANTFQAAYRMRSEAAFAIHEFFRNRNFVYVHTPIITSSDGEGAGEMFRVTTAGAGKPPEEDYFGKWTGLTVTGQLNAEAMAQAFGRVYTFGPTFRAEKSYTPRHAAEFWMIEPEFCFADLNDNMDLIEDMLKHIIRHLFSHCPDELDFFNRFVDTGLIAKLENVIHSNFERISYTEGFRLLEQSGHPFEYPVAWGSAVQLEHEKYLADTVFGQPVFLTDYPKDLKSFYMRLNDDEKTVACTDLLVPGLGEIVGASQREERLDVLIRRMEELGMDAASYAWYLDLRRWGTVPHSGYGLGFERFLMYVTGIANIRDVIPFPRTTGSAEF
jgi:asparaginyl-tRNA synthetase